MRPRGCRIPLEIKLRGLPDDDRLLEMSDAIARAVADRLADAERVITVREGWFSWRKTYAAPDIDFSGSDLDGDFQRRLAAAIEAGIARAVGGRATSASPAIPLLKVQYTPPARQPAPQSRPSRPAAAPKPPARAAASKPQPEAPSWRVRIEVHFRITPRGFFDIPSTPWEVDPKELYFDLLDTPRAAVAWVIETQREYEFNALTGEALTRFANKRAGEHIWALHGFSGLRLQLIAADLDHVLQRRVPDFSNRGLYEVSRDDNTVKLAPGAWIISAFLPLPKIVLADLIELRGAQALYLKVRDCSGFITAKDFGAYVGLDWAEVQKAAPDSDVAVLIEPFTVRRRVHTRTLAALFRHDRQKIWGTPQLGRTVLLADSSLQDLPPALRDFLSAPPIKTASKRSAGIDHAGFWQPGAQGADLTFQFAPDLADQVLLGLNSAFLAQQVAEVQRILGLTDTLWNADRTQALGPFIDSWSHRSAKLFGLLLGMLDRIGKLDEFLAAIQGLGWFDTSRKRDVVALIVETRYAQHPRVLEIIRQIEAGARSVERFRYDFDAQVVWIDANIDGVGKPLKAAGDSSDDKAGVVGVLVPYYSDSARIPQPKPELLQRLSAPTRKKIGEYMARTICKPGETMTQKELMQKAMQQAANELSPPPSEDDFNKVTMRVSVRVIKIDRKAERGITETYVYYQDVRKIGDGPWEPAGEIEMGSPQEFEARLRLFHVKHLQELLSLFVLTETVLYGALLVVVLEVATIGTLIFFVAFQVAVYYLNTDAEDRTAEGYLIAALKGELDAVGWKLLSGYAKTAGQLVATRLISSELLGEVATKWIVFSLRNTVTATFVGGFEVASLFAEDLLRWGNCQGFSSPGQYWERFKMGFIMTLVLEFVAVPILAPPLRYALDKAGSAVEVARALRASGKTLREITSLLLEGGEKLNEALGRTLDRPDVVGPVTQSLRQRVWDVIKALGREYEGRAYRSLIELYGPDLSVEATRGLRRLLAAASEDEIDGALQRLVAQRASPAAFFRALSEVDDKLLSDLVKTGQLAQLGTSPRVLALLTKDAATGSKILAGPFKTSVGELERYLGRLDELTPQVRESVLRALVQDNPLPPNILLAAARQVGALDEPTVALLRQLQAARIRIEAFFNGSGPSLTAFAEDFAKLSEAERAAALQGAAGRSPAQVLAQAEKARVEAIAKAQAEAKRLAEEAEAKAKEAERQAKLAAFKAAREAREVARLEAEHKVDVADAEKRGKLPPAGSSDRSWLDADPTGRRKELAYDPPQDKFRVREAKAALAAETAGEPVKLTSPVRRSVAPGKAETGVDFVDGAGTQWDHVQVTDPATANATIEAKAHPARPGVSGENALVDLLDFSPADARKIVNAWNAASHPVGTGKVVFAMP